MNDRAIELRPVIKWVIISTLRLLLYYTERQESSLSTQHLPTGELDNVQNGRGDLHRSVFKVQVATANAKQLHTVA